MAVADARGKTSLASLSDCGPCSQLRAILIWVEFLCSVLLFMFVLVHFLSLGPLTHLGSLGSVSGSQRMVRSFLQSAFGPLLSLGHLSRSGLSCFLFCS